MSFDGKPLFAFDRDICDCLLKTLFAPLIRRFLFVLFFFSRETVLFVRKEKGKISALIRSLYILLVCILLMTCFFGSV